MKNINKKKKPTKKKKTRFFTQKKRKCNFFLSFFPSRSRVSMYLPTRAFINFRGGDFQASSDAEASVDFVSFFFFSLMNAKIF